jgi:hypothetical protein
MEDLEKYVDFLYEDQTGYVYSPVKTPNSWDQVFFAWPSERGKLISHVRDNSSKGDVYISPAVYSRKEATKEAFKSSKVVWVEFDGQEAINFKDQPTPDAIVQTSLSTHVHCYWKTEKLSTGTSVDEINRRLTYYLGADSSGWDCTQLLRPPTSTNAKRGGLPVLLASFNAEYTEKPISVFSGVPEVAVKHIEIKEASLQNPKQLLAQLPLLKSLKTKLENENPDVGDRSQFLFKIAHELAESGCNHSQIATLINFVNDRIGKFADTRADKLTRISEIASIAIHSVESEEEIPVYSFIDVLEHTDDLEWVFEKWLHSQGLMIISGAPGVGKTQFCLNLMYAFSVGERFLGFELPQKKSLFMSLEMDVRELKYVLKKQAVGYSNVLEGSKNLSIIDVPGSLLQYEELFERVKPDIVFTDSLLELADGDLGNGPELLQLTRWMKRMRRKYNFALIMIHHNRKANTGNKKPNRLEDLFGGVILNKQIDTALVLWQDEDAKHIDLLAAKSRFDERRDYKIERTDSLTFEVKQDSTVIDDTESSPGTPDPLILTF